MYENVLSLYLAGGLFFGKDSWESYVDATEMHKTTFVLTIAY